MIYVETKLTMIAKDGIQIKTITHVSIVNQMRKRRLLLYFNPSLILGGNVVDGILENIGDIWDQTALYIPEGERRICIWQLKVGEKLIPFVDMHHPSAVKGMSDYYLELFHALKEVERTHPGYWETRLNMPCFINAH